MRRNNLTFFIELMRKTEKTEALYAILARMRLSRRTATTRFNLEGMGCQKQTAPRFCQHPINLPFPDERTQTFSGWGLKPLTRPILL